MFYGAKKKKQSLGLFSLVDGKDTHDTLSVHCILKYLGHDQRHKHSCILRSRASQPLHWIHFGPGKFFVVGGCRVHCRKLTGIPDLHQ